MNCEVIFYLAAKTNLCEKELKKSINGLDLNFTDAFFATEPQTLGNLIIDKFENSNVVFVIGGLTGEKTGIENVLSRALAGKSPDDLKKLRNPLSPHDGYLIRQGGQLLVVLPDSPDEIREILSAELKGYLEQFTDF